MPASSIINEHGLTDFFSRPLLIEDIRLCPYTMGARMPVDLQTWNEMRKSSLEVAVTHSQNLEYWQFASNECLYFARIDCLVRRFDTTPPESLLSLTSPANDRPSVVEHHPVGLVYLTPSQCIGELSVGIALAAGHRGAGRARVALKKLLAWVFEEAGYHRVQAAIIEGPCRLSAMNLFANVGFSHEGIRRRQVYSQTSQQWMDVTYMAIVDTDWTSRKFGLSVPKTRWGDLFERQQREREELLELESKRQIRAPKRTYSMETIKESDFEAMPCESEAESEMGEKGGEIQIVVEECMENDIPSTQDNDLPFTEEEDPSLSSGSSARPYGISILPKRCNDSTSNADEDRNSVDGCSSETSDLGVDDIMSPPPDSDYCGSVSGSSFAGIDSDFDDNMSTKSWDRCSVAGSV